MQCWADVPTNLLDLGGMTSVVLHFVSRADTVSFIVLIET